MREPTSTLFTDVVVFDGTDFHSGTRDVLVREGRIERVASHGEIQAPQDVRTVNGSGHTLTPGFIDCHVHLTVSNAGSLAGFAEPFSTQFYRSVDNMRRTLDAGVTTVRDAGGADAGLKHSLATGLVRGPRVKLAVSIMSQTGGHGDSWLLSGACSPMLAPHTGRPDGVADGPDGVRRKAREILRAGADQIKICSTGGVLSPDDDPQHSQFGPDEIEVIVAEARAQGAYVMSHAQGAPGIKNALRAGARSVEHGIFLDDEAIELFLEHDAFLVPTLQAPLAVITAHEAGVPLPPGVAEKARRVAQAHSASVAKAHDAGVKIAMGTDAGVGAHGENLEEIELMAANGMSTVHALRAATSTAAQLIEEPCLGNLERGATADLVLLQGDLHREGVTQLRGRVRGVWQAGERVR
ncbi:amidohydrolase family protein [Kocuria sp.]|uniref:metal-dependent hydrolase family protein n=1 Tax=Kocuria sp. TaxID=1871328 RepID=UPI0025C0E75D|nr:amidohydrolase family protein [Kocuria sp.]